MKDVVVLGAAHGVAAVFFDLVDVLGSEVCVCEEGFDLLASVVAARTNGGPIVAIAEELAAESCGGVWTLRESVRDPLPERGEAWWLAEGECETRVDEGDIVRRREPIGWCAVSGESVEEWAGESIDRRVGEFLEGEADAVDADEFGLEKPAWHSRESLVGGIDGDDDPAGGPPPLRSIGVCEGVLGSVANDGAGVAAFTAAEVQGQTERPRVCGMAYIIGIERGECTQERFAGGLVGDGVEVAGPVTLVAFGDCAFGIGEGHVDILWLRLL